MKLDIDPEEEITDEELKKIEEELMGLTGPFPLSQPSEERIEGILKRAKLEAIGAETLDFTRDGVVPAVKGIIDSFLKLKQNEVNRSDPKPPDKTTR